MTKTAGEWLTRKEAAAYLTSIGRAIATKTLANLALQLPFLLSSESMGNHDSGFDEWRRVG